MESGLVHDMLSKAMEIGLLPLSIAAIALSLSGLIVYRLFLSPLANIPGPKLAAATQLVEIYYDIVKGGQYIFKVEEWHAKYGPIIRISPNQVHILDPEYFDELYSMKRPRHNKPERLANRLHAPEAIGDYPDAEEHDRRRAIVAPLFSRQRVTEFTESLQARANKICDNLASMRGKPEPINLTEAWSSYAADNVIWFIASMSYNFVDYPGFKSPFTLAVRNVVMIVHLVSHFPILWTLMDSLPPNFLKKMNPELVSMLDFIDAVRTQVRKVVFGENDGHKAVAHRTVFHELSLTLGQGPSALKAMEDDAVTMVMAGIETSSRMLSVICFWVAKEPQIRARVLAELDAAFPDPNYVPTYPELERLPYFSAVITEGFRCSAGVAERLVRYNPNTSIRYQDYVLPPRTEFSMTPALQHRLEQTFPDANTFNPDRWLGSPVSPSSGKPLSKYLVQFSKGSRNCIGMHLATAQIYIGFATMMRRFGTEWELAEGCERDVVDLGGDYLAPVPKNDTGVKVVVK